MGKRGPAPEPVGLKILKGLGNGRDSAGRPIPVPPPFAKGCPDPPDWLAPEARELWLRVAPALDALELLKPEDGEVFAAYCSSWARFSAAVKTYQREGLVVAMPPSGRLLAHPAVAVAESAGKDLLRFASQFGLTPAAQVALAKPVKPVTSDDDKFSGA